MSLYRVSPIPIDHIEIFRQQTNPPSIPSSPTYGIDAPLGLIASLWSAPLYLYATLSGKFQVWEALLHDIVKDIDLSEPCLDCGCGRGMVLLMLARLKKELVLNGVRTSTLPVYGIDIFNSFDQTSNSSLSTCQNAASAELLEYIILHTGTFLDLPFADDSFCLVTSSLAIHNVSNKEEKQRAIRECARVTKPGGWLLIVDLKGSVALYENTLRELGWHSIERKWAGMKMMYGMWPCEILKGTKPLRTT
ncbi:unnamed protein product [Adineta steineri]|uniref:Methyltransferase type 11 domain-containing protein n=1 Tax=Adineta steineri TaxID=433720 RepID=A0A819B0A9_9BILA|nr:unnamed protein product [Adineta steineri]CAF3790408.1 unnamed protein product [Adineta steineri]CAF3859741.1 unnamed protein product [Adineta steineri]